MQASKNLYYLIVVEQWLQSLEEVNNDQEVRLSSTLTFFNSLKQKYLTNLQRNAYTYDRHRSKEIKLT